MRDENGLEKCVACGLCAVACPADAIYLEAAENDGSVQAGPRYAKVYQIHKTRCIFCGYCEEACPVSAIFMGKDYELAVYSNKDFIWDKADLLVPAATSDSDLNVGAGRLQRPAPTLCHAFGALGDIHGDFASVRRIMRQHPDVRSGCASAMSPTPRGATSRSRRRSTGSRATTKTSIRSRAGDLPAELDYIQNGSSQTIDGLRVAGLGGTFAPTLYETPAAGAAAPEEGHGEGHRLGRPAPAFRPRGGRGVQGAHGRRHLADARSGAAVLVAAPGGAATTRARRRSTSARGDEAAAAPLRPSSSVHRAGARRACDRSASICVSLVSAD